VPVTKRMELIDVGGIARMRGVSHQRASQLAAHPKFPAPVPVAGGSRKVWNAAEVRAFFATPRKPGRPRKPPEDAA